MRWILASVALANIVMLIYFLFIDENTIQLNQPLSNSTRGNLVLLSERDKVSRRQPLSVSTTKKITNADETLCTLVGPFVSLLRAEYFIERLAALNVAANIKELTIKTGSNHWVYLKPEISRKKALRRLAELQKKGIDSYIIPTGDLANGISLGIYTSRERAVAMHDRAIDMGYTPKISDVPRQQQQIWTFITANEASMLDEETWLSLLANESPIERRKNICSELLI